MNYTYILLAIFVGLMLLLISILNGIYDYNRVVKYLSKNKISKKEQNKIRVICYSKVFADKNRFIKSNKDISNQLRLFISELGHIDEWNKNHTDRLKLLWIGTYKKYPQYFFK